MAADLSTTHFELFGLPRSFDVDLQLLDRNYRELQRSVHPDRFVNASDQERRISMQQATQLNEGYQALKDPLKRGRYLLELDGRKHDDERNTTSDKEFLMEQMELREALADVRGSEDAFLALGRIMDRIAADIDRLIGALQDQFGKADADSLDAAADTLTKMQFFRRLQDEAGEIEADLEDELA
jgi:molecular chaperone HscB